jgi:hypothetical protein
MSLVGHVYYVTNPLEASSPAPPDTWRLTGPMATARGGPTATLPAALTNRAGPGQPPAATRNRRHRARCTPGRTVNHPGSPAGSRAMPAPVAHAQTTQQG